MSTSYGHGRTRNWGFTHPPGLYCVKCHLRQSGSTCGNCIRNVEIDKRSPTGRIPTIQSTIAR